MRKVRQPLDRDVSVECNPSRVTCLKPKTGIRCTMLTALNQNIFVPGLTKETIKTENCKLLLDAIQIFGIKRR
jgi:hypothetical protein